MGRGQQEAALLPARREGDETLYKQLAATYRAQLTDEEASALSSYSRTVHNLVNRVLRGQGEQTDDYWAGSWLPVLESALAKAIELEQPLTLHRAFTSKDFFRRRYRVGDIFSDPGFCSTSIHETAVQRFANEWYATPERTPPPHRVYWTIEAPAGAKLAPLGVVADNPFEYECLLPAGARFQVLAAAKSRRQGGCLRLELQLLV